MATAEEVMRSPQELFTIALESLDRQIADLQAELKQPAASIEQACGAQTVVGSHARMVIEGGTWLKLGGLSGESQPGKVR